MNESSGDCDQDSQCDKGLKCFQRSGTTAVPGCTGKGVTNHDYCIKPTVKPTKPKKTTKKKPSKPAIKDFGANAHSRPGTLKLCQGD